MTEDELQSALATRPDHDLLVIVIQRQVSLERRFQEHLDQTGPLIKWVISTQAQFRFAWLGLGMFGTLCMILIAAHAAGIF